MANKHQGKIIPNILAGILIVTTGIVLIFFTLKPDFSLIEKFLLATGIAVIINIGLFFWGSGFVHKVKSDLIRRKKQHDEKDIGLDQ
jgi:FtsH-binding integral membrane protein